MESQQNQMNRNTDELHSQPVRGCSPDGVVLIVGSLGGFKAFQRILASLPRKAFQGRKGKSVVMMLHRSPSTTTDLGALLQSHCLLPVSEPDDKDAMVIGHVYIAPADYHLLLEGRHFALSTEGPVNHSRPAIDPLFQSAAFSFGKNCLAVILSGNSDDGAQGAETILKAGGDVWVQNPNECEAPIMPVAALALVPSARILSLDEITAELVALGQATQARWKGEGNEPHV
ncbi:chemotaxis protein CheB [Litoribacillus peritrichatus]|uniref:chemotaxis protein CheB n=1 Tax=Litoribacillus peritrichatus TaxID=718191 RepID=UPI0031D34468